MELIASPLPIKDLFSTYCSSKNPVHMIFLGKSQYREDSESNEQ